MNDRLVPRVTGFSVALVAVLLLARSLVVPPFAFHERQWDAHALEAPPLREGATRWARIVSVTDATLARPGGLVVEWRGFLAVDRDGPVAVLIESAGPTTVTIDGRVAAQATGGEETRARGIVTVAAGAREIVVRAEVPEGGAFFRGVLRTPDDRTVPFEDAEATTEPRGPAAMRAARAHRAWADPLLALAALVASLGIAASWRRPQRRLFAEIAATVVVFGVALLAPHGPGLSTWGTWFYGGASIGPRVLILVVGLIPWIAVRRGWSGSLPALARSPVFAAAAAAAIFWLLRERRFWGDAWITLEILEGRASVGAFGPFFWKEPLDRLIAVLATQSASGFGADAAPAIAATGCIAGVATVAMLFQHARRADDGGATALLTLTCGAALVFFGHVENYSWVSAAIVAFLLAATPPAGSVMKPLLVGSLGGLAIAFHPVAVFAVAPALVVMALTTPHAAPRLFAGASLPLAALVLGCLAAGIAPPALGLNRFADDPAVFLSLREAFAPAHLATIANRLALLLSPGIAFALLAGIGRRPSAEARALSAAAIGSVVCIVFLHGKIRPAVMDWDLYAPAAFPLAMLAARALRGADAAPARAWCAGISAAVLLLGVLGNR